MKRDLNEKKKSYHTNDDIFFKQQKPLKFTPIPDINAPSLSCFSCVRQNKGEQAKQSL